MAESKAKIEFQTTKKLFEAVAENVVCSYCEVVPRKGPIYQKEPKRQKLNEGDKDTRKIRCGECLPKPEKHKSFQRNVALEKMLYAYPITYCKFRKNDCKIVQDLKNIEYHEEDCKFRDILCPMFDCNNIVSLKNLDNHLKESHRFINFDIEDEFLEIEGNVFKFKDFNDDDDDSSDDSSDEDHFRHFRYNGDLFLVHIDSKSKTHTFWIQIWGSKFEAKNYNWSIQIGDSTHGRCMFQGPVKSLDDDKNEALEKQYGLVVSRDFVKKFTDDEGTLTLEIEIENLKPQEEQADYEEPMEATTANDDKEKDPKKSE